MNTKQPLRIISLIVRNFQRIQAVYLEVGPKGLTTIGGKNNQGKTSALNAIRWALGGAKFAPAKPRKTGADEDPLIQVKLSNGLTVERRGKAGALHVTSEDGMKGGQTMLDALLSHLALDLTAFLEAPAREKADLLLQAIGVDLTPYDRTIGDLFAQRRDANRDAKQRTAYADKIQVPEDAPTRRVSVDRLTKEYEEAVALSRTHAQNADALEDARQDVADAEADETNALRQLSAARAAKGDADQSLKEALELPTDPVDTEVKRVKITNANTLNARYETRKRKKDAQAHAAEANRTAYDLNAALEEARREREDVIGAGRLPLAELTVSEEGALLYEGQEWDGTSGSARLIIATAIAQATRPDCRFVLLDNAEMMDLDTLAAFGAWAEDQDLQVICSRVSVGDECELVIEDGVAGEIPEPAKAPAPAKRKRKPAKVTADENGLEPGVGDALRAADEGRGFADADNRTDSERAEDQRGAGELPEPEPAEEADEDLFASFR